MVNVVGIHEVASTASHIGEHCDWDWFNQY